MTSPGVWLAARYGASVDLRDLRLGFRDDDQNRQTRVIIHDRLADDRLQDECRCLMKFWWQLVVSYQEVTIDELREHVSAPKLAVVDALIDALSESPESVDAWIAETIVVFPVIHDRGNPES